MDHNGKQRSNKGDRKMLNYKIITPSNGWLEGRGVGDNWCVVDNVVCDMLWCKMWCN